MRIDCVRFYAQRIYNFDHLIALVSGLVVALLWCHNYISFLDGSVFPKWMLLFTACSIISVALSIKLYFIKPMISTCWHEIIAVVLFVMMAGIVSLRADFVKVILIACSSITLYLLGKYWWAKVRQTCLCAAIFVGIITIASLFWNIMNGRFQTIVFFENTVHTSLNLCLSFIALIESFASLYNRILRWLYLSLIVIIFAVTFFIGSRVGVMVEIGTLMIFFIKRNNLSRYILIGLIIASPLLIAYKWNSSMGRLFIYRTAITMLDTPKNILIGRGENGFRRDYMVHQAQKLENQTHEIRQRADSIHHPLNELLSLAIDYGIICVILFVAAIWSLMSGGILSSLQISAFLAIVAFSCVTYPFRYPESWIIICLLLGSINKKGIKKVKFLSGRYISMGLICIGIFTCYQVFAVSLLHLKWTKACNYMSIGCFDDARNIYEDIGKDLSTPEYKYNYASALLRMGLPFEAWNIISQCVVVNYDVMMLKGNIAKSCGLMNDAIKSYTLAHKMCPNRFIPMIELYNIYYYQCDWEQARIIGMSILKKDVKIPSEKISQGIMEVKKSLKTIDK